MPDDKAEEDKKIDLHLVESIKDAFRESVSSEPGGDLPERRSQNWLVNYLKYTKEQESPEIFHLWCALSALASVAKRHIYMPRGHYTLFSNLYVVLVGTSAAVKKSTAIGIAERFVSQSKIADVNIAKDKLTPEGLIHRMATRISSTEYAETGKLKRDCSIYIIADEMGLLLSNVAYTTGLTEMLTSLFNCKDHMEVVTKHDPETLNYVCANLLGGSTPEWLGTGMPEYHKSGGFLGRFVFVVAHKPRKKISFPTMTEEGIALQEILADDLSTIARLRGEIKMTPEFMSTYDAWYQKFEVGEDPRLREYLNRKPDLVLKLSMLFSISTDNKLIADIQHFRAAITVLDNVERTMLDAFMFLGSTNESRLGRVVLSTLSTSGKLSKRVLLRAVSHRIRRVSDFNEVLEMLVQEGRIKKEVGGNDSIYYRVTTSEELRFAEKEKARKATILTDIFKDDGTFI